MIFTTENLLDNLDKLGPWSQYGLASEAIKYYFPDEYDEEGYIEPNREVELLQGLGYHYWADIIKKYHIEVGYKPDNGIFNTEYVNGR